MWMMIIVVAIALACVAFDVARSSRCEQCERPYAVFSIRGLLRIPIRVCRRCRRSHLRRQETHAR